MSDDFEDEARKRLRALAILGDTSNDDNDVFDNNDALENVPYERDTVDVVGEMPDPTGLSSKISLRDQLHQDLQDEAKWVRINPVSALRGVLGGQQQVSSGQKLT